MLTNTQNGMEQNEILLFSGSLSEIFDFRFRDIGYGCLQCDRIHVPYLEVSSYMCTTGCNELLVTN